MRSGSDGTIADIENKLERLIIILCISVSRVCTEVADYRALDVRSFFFFFHPFKVLLCSRRVNSSSLSDRTSCLSGLRLHLSILLREECVNYHLLSSQFFREREVAAA